MGSQGGGAALATGQRASLDLAIACTLRQGLCPSAPRQSSAFLHFLQVLSPGGTRKVAPGTSRPWMVSWSSGLDLKTCSPSSSGSPTLFLRKGFISRFLAVLTSSGRSCFLKLHEAVGCSLPHYSPQSLHGLEVAKARTVV